MKINRLKKFLFLLLVMSAGVVGFWLSGNLPNSIDNKNILKELPGTAQEPSAGNENPIDSDPWNTSWSEKTETEMRQMIEGMSSSQKAGQLLMFAAKGQTVTTEYEKELREISPGGVIYMGANIQSEKQLADFTKDIQATNTRIPLLVATDQEGGVVKRLGWDNTASQLEWAKLSKDNLCQQAKSRGEILRNSGINVNFSPVVDLTTAKGGFINNRTISPDHKVVIRAAGIYVDCLQSVPVAATLKHFPGHGATVEDSHYVLPEIGKSKNDWLKTDASPFKELKQSNLVMVGHLYYKNIDSQQPASQSQKMITAVLRQEFGYQGVVITDDMGQLHTSTNITSREAMKNSINAGVDIILYVNAPRDHRDIVSELAKLIESGEVSETKVDAALLRIFKLKQRLYN